jgi:ADP-ribose pyrophosphatase YjhB (NUDIX family)
MSFIPGIFKRFYWQHFKPDEHGVACLIECDGHILLIRHRYGKKQIWSVPSGKKTEYEKPKRAVVRAVWNLMGIDVRSAQEVNTILVDHDDPDNTIHCFIVHADDMSLDEDKDLVAEAKWFDLEGEIPPKLTLVAKVLIQKLKFETLFQVCDNDPMNPACQVEPV